MYWDEAALAAPVADARFAMGSLWGRLQGFGFEVAAEAELELAVEEAISTSQIEGERLSRSEVKSSMAQRLKLPQAGYREFGAVPTNRHVEGIVEVMIDATHNFQAILDEERLFSWHSSLFPDGWSGGHRIKVGGWSDWQMRVVDRTGFVVFEAPPPERTALEMERFLAWFEQTRAQPTLLRASQAHLWFETIHPFQDGNGRIGRAIAELALAQAEQCPTRYYSLSSQILKERSDYYRQLNAQSRCETLDITAWHRWFIGVIERSIATSEEILHAVLRRAKHWRRAAEFHLNERQRTVLNLLLDDFQGKLRTGKYAKLTKTSPDTALRDLMQMVEFGILRQEGAGAGTHYLLAPLPEH